MVVCFERNRYQQQYFWGSPTELNFLTWPYTYNNLLLHKPSLGLHQDYLEEYALCLFQIYNKLKDQVDNVLLSYSTKPSEQFEKDASIKLKFIFLAFQTFLGIVYQTQYVQLLNSYLRDDVFIENLMQYCNK